MSSRALNPEQFGGYTMVHEPPEMGRDYHQVRALDERGWEAGKMLWNAKHVLNVGVTPGFERRGIATAMWTYGQQATPKPKHSADRTDAGDAWARSVGGKLPRRRRG